MEWRQILNNQWIPYNYVSANRFFLCICCLKISKDILFLTVIACRGLRICIRYLKKMKSTHPIINVLLSVELLSMAYKISCLKSHSVKMKVEFSAF